VVDWPPFVVSEIVLFQSAVTPIGATFTPLEVISLKEIF